MEGVKAIPFDEVAQRFTPLVGKDVTIGELMETANGVTALYKERGYRLVNRPHSRRTRGIWPVLSFA